MDDLPRVLPGRAARRLRLRGLDDAQPQARTQVGLHIVLLALSLAFLPIIADSGWKPAGDEDPTWRIVGRLTGYTHSPLIPAFEKSGMAVFKKPVLVQYLVEFLQKEIT